MSKQETKRVIIVLSSGRSGTSLLMQILGRLGMSLSESLIGPHHENPDGFFEDAEIVSLHKQLLADLGAKPTLPLPERWESSGAVAPYLQKIRTLVEENISRTGTIWGFKDPRTSSLLPLWIRVLKSMWVVPTFVLAVREPGAAVRSIIKQAGLSGEMAELVWLFRTCDALINTAGDCCIVHYEDWFARPAETADELLRHTGLDGYFSGEVGAALEGIIKPNLNRAVHDEYQVTNPYVARLYAVLKECHGADFDRAKLMQAVKECRMAMDSFRGWYMDAHKNQVAEGEAAQQQGQLRKRLERKQAEVDKLTEELKTASALREADQVKHAQELAEVRQQFQKKLNAEQEKHEQAIAEAKRQSQEMLNAEQEKHAKVLSEMENKMRTAFDGELNQREQKISKLKEDIGAMATDLELITLQNNTYLKQLKLLHEKAEGLAIKISSIPQKSAAVVPPRQVTQQPNQAKSAEKAKPNQAQNTVRKKMVDAAPQPQGRGGRLWKKFKKDPQQFFADSRLPVLRPLRYLFKKLV